MDRFFGRVEGDRAVVEGEEFRHFKVKRVKVGDAVEVVDGESSYLCRVRKIEKKRAELEVLEKLPPRLPKVSVILYQCVPIKLSTFDEVIEVASQTGAEEIVPVISKRSFQKVSVLEEKRRRWEAVARESLKQCGRQLPIRIGKPIRLEEIKVTDGLKIFPFERGGENLCSFLEGKREQKAAVIVGAEGGFAEEEAEFLKRSGWNAVSLGDFVLKTPTAAAVSVATIYNALAKNHVK